MSRTGKPTEAESRLVAARGWEAGQGWNRVGGAVTADGHRGFSLR